MIPPSASPFSVSPVRETLRWQSRARRPLEVGGVWPSSARPPSIVSGSERWRAPAPAAGSRDAPTLHGRAGRLRQSRCDGFGAAAGSSRGPEEGDAACACPAQLPPQEMNMSLPGRVSCSMLNCFVSAAFSPPPPPLHASRAVSQLLSPAPMLSRLPQIRPVLEARLCADPPALDLPSLACHPPEKGDLLLPPTCCQRTLQPLAPALLPCLGPRARQRPAP